MSQGSSIELKDFGETNANEAANANSSSSHVNGSTRGTTTSDDDKLEGNSKHVAFDMTHNTEDTEPAPRTRQFGSTSIGRGPTLDQKEKLLGIPKYQSHITGGLAGDRSYNYEEKYPPDDPGQELGENARVWKVYLDEAEVYDDDMVRGFRDTIDSLLVFAALFSAVVTTFVVETSQALQPDYAQITSVLLAEQIQILRANGNASAINVIPSSSPSLGPAYTSSDVWVNGLFFTSLSLSLATALLSVLVKQWIQAYTSVASGSAKSRALVRQFRFSGLMKWKLPEIIGILPLILHSSLAVFLAGLAVYVRSLNVSLSWPVIGISTFAFAFYLGSLSIPALAIDCPYRIPILFTPTQYVLFPLKCCLTYAQYIVKRYWQRKRRYSSEWPVLQMSLRTAELAYAYKDITLGDGISWLYDVSSNSSVIRVAIRAAAQCPNTLFSPSVVVRMANTIWKHIQNYKDTSRDAEKYAEVWIPAMKSITQDQHYKEKAGFELISQAGRGNTDVVKLLLECGMDVNRPIGPYHRTPLHTASSYGQLEIAQILLQNDAEVNAVGLALGKTALYAAADNGHLNVVKFLLENGADANVYCAPFGTALYAAADTGHDDVVKLLLENGANVNAYCGRYGSALSTASALGHLDTVKLLLENGANVNAKAEIYGTALEVASFYGELAIVKTLLESGATVDTQGGYYGTALQCASARGHLDIVRTLLESGADVHAEKGRFGYTLEAASTAGHLDIAKVLLESGADARRHVIIANGNTNR